MTKLYVNPVDSLQGEIEIQGSKNGVLPILAASILNKGISKINNCPHITDVENTVEILKTMGCYVKWDGDSIIIDSTYINDSEIPKQVVNKMRSSIIFLGALVARCKTCTIGYPGGCNIGSRPIDLHISSLEKMNIKIIKQENKIHAFTSQIKGTPISLSFPSVGATENIMLAATKGNGVTTIRGGAKEPEIFMLADFLNAMGGNIKRDAYDNLIITGTDALHDVEYDLPGDRIVAGTYLIAVAATCGSVRVGNVPGEHLEALINQLKAAGCNIKCRDDNIFLEQWNSPKAVNVITGPYPEFPTDLQPQMMAMLSVSNGNGIVYERVFESRFATADELVKMGADISPVSDKILYVRGVPKLKGALVKAKDLRSGAALVIAGLLAKGDTVINDCDYIFRGYENISKDFENLGAKITRMEG